MTAPTARRTLRTTLAVALAAIALAAAAVALAALKRPSTSWQIHAVEVVPAAASGAPVTAFVAATCAGCREPLLQLRVCPVGPDGAVDDATCDVAARRAPGATVTVLRYGRTLAGGRHRVEVLFLQSDRLGASRSTARVEGWVDVR